MAYMIDASTGKRRDAEQLTEEMYLAIDKTWNGQSAKTISKELGVPTQTLAAWRRSKAWKEEWQMMAINELQIESPKALAELKRLALKSDSESVRLKALNSWLDRAGLVSEEDKSDVNLQVNFANVEMGDYAE